MDVLEQAVLRAIRRDEHRAGDVPLLLVEERAHRGRALAGEGLEVVNELGRTVTKRRPGPAVDRPAEPRSRVRRVTVRRPGGKNPAGDHRPPDLRRRIRQRNVQEQRRLAGLGEPLGPGRSEDGTPRHGQAPSGAGPVLENVEDAMAARVAPRQERRPRRPGVRGEARTRHPSPSAFEERLEARQLACFEQWIEDVPVCAVPADDEHPLRHGRGGYPRRPRSRSGLVRDRRRARRPAPRRARRPARSRPRRTARIGARAPSGRRRMPSARR